MKYKNIIWDWNGTIINDTPISVEATNILLQRFGYPTITFEYYRDNVDTPIVNFYGKIFNLNKHDVEMIDDEWGILYDQLSEKIDLHTGVKEMLCFFAKNNLNQIILSAFKTIEITKYARRFSIEHYFDDILGTQNIVMESKTVRGTRYMLEHGFAPELTLYIGDTVHDYETSRDLDVDCILFSGGQQSPKLLKNAEYLFLIHLLILQIN